MQAFSDPGMRHEQKPSSCWVIAVCVLQAEPCLDLHVTCQVPGVAQRRCQVNCGTVQAGTGLHLLLPNPQALRQGRVTTGLLAGLREHHEEGRGQAPLGQGRTCQAEPHPLCPLGSCCEPELPPEGAPFFPFLCLPKARKSGAEQVPGRRGSPRPSFPLHSWSSSPATVISSEFSEKFLLFHFI